MNKEEFYRSKIEEQKRVNERILSLDDVKDDVNSVGGTGRSLMAPDGNGGFFIFPGFYRTINEKKLIKFIPFIRDDIELSLFGARSIAKIMFSLNIPPSTIIIPHQRSNSFPMLSAAIATYEQLRSSEMKGNFIANKVVLRSDDPNSFVSWATRIAFKPNVLGFSKEDANNLLLRINQREAVCIIDDTRRSGRTETTILKLLSMILEKGQLLELFESEKLSTVYLCSEYNPRTENPIHKLGKNSKAVFHIPFEEIEEKTND